MRPFLPSPLVSVLRPALFLGAAGMLVVGCQTTVEEDDDDGAGGSSSTSATTTTSVTSSATTGGGVSLPAGCWNGPADCNPLNNEGCAAGEACDAGFVEATGLSVTCFPPPNSQALGATCDANQGPFCQGGGTCVQGTCVALCCSAADCTGGVPCTPFEPNMGTLGACAEAPMCAGPGGSCSAPADCCSNNCHAGHCH